MEMPRVILDVKVLFVLVVPTFFIIKIIPVIVNLVLYYFVFLGRYWSFYGHPRN